VKRRIDLRFSSSSGVLFEMWRLGICKGTFASGYNSDVVNEAYECVIADELFNVSDLHHEDICAYKARRMVASPSLRCEAARRRVVTAVTRCLGIPTSSLSMGHPPHRYSTSFTPTRSHSQYHRSIILMSSSMRHCEASVDSIISKWLMATSSNRFPHDGLICWLFARHGERMCIRIQCTLLPSLRSRMGQHQAFA
jgi:hypothetical protein